MMNHLSKSLFAFSDEYDDTQLNSTRLRPETKVINRITSDDEQFNDEWKLSPSGSVIEMALSFDRNKYDSGKCILVSKTDSGCPSCVIS